MRFRSVVETPHVHDVSHRALGTGTVPRLDERPPVLARARLPRIVDRRGAIVTVVDREQPIGIQIRSVLEPIVSRDVRSGDREIGVSQGPPLRMPRIPEMPDRRIGCYAPTRPRVAEIHDPRQLVSLGYLPCEN